MTRAVWLGVLVLLGLLLVIALAIALARWRRRRRAARQVEAVLRASVPAPPSLPDTTSLAAQIRAALAEAGGRGRSPRRARALPRYLVLGDAAAGKRSVAAGLGLSFAPRAERGACWLAPEALVIVAPASTDASRSGWTEALDVLRRTRARHPLDGVLLCLDVGLLLGEEAAIEASADALRGRLSSLTDRLGVRPPVYVLLTKCDRLTGFTDTFCSLAPAERRHPWGFTLPVRDDQAADAQLTRRLARLALVIERRAITALGASRAPDACARVHALPAVVTALEAPLRRLLAIALARDAQLGAPLLRGVYLTGVIAPDVRDHGGDPLATGRVTPMQPERLFLRDLFARAILPDAGLAHPTPAGARRAHRIARASGLCVSVLCAAFACFELRAYLHNRRLLDALRGALIEARRGDAEPLRASVHALAGHARGGVPPAFGVGLYQGALLRPDAERVYASIVRRAWVVPYVRGLARDLSGQAAAHHGPPVAGARADEHARMHATLERYLRWTRDDGAAPPRVGERTSWLLDGLAARAPAAPHAQLAAYLALIAERPELAVARDAQLVADARARLRGMPAAHLAVDRLEAALAVRGPALSVEALIGTTGSPLRGARQVPFAFTRRGWEEHVRELLEAPSDALLGESWVLGDGTGAAADAARDARVCALRAAYFERYAAQWRALLGSVRTATPGDAAEALAVLEALTHGQPPALERLAQEVARNARLDLPPAANEVREAGLLERLERAVGSTAHAAASASGPRVLSCDGRADAGPGSVLTALGGFGRFAVLDAQESAPGAAPAVTAARLYHEQLAYLRDALHAHRADPRDAEPLLARLATAESVARQLIDAQEVGWRPRFEALLQPPLLGLRAGTSGDLARQKAASWCTSVVLPFQQGLAGHYPFDVAGPDASLADVMAFYRPESGQLWSSYDALLAHDVPRTGDQFGMRAGAPLARRYRAALPAFLARSRAIVGTLFEPSGSKLRVDFEVRVRPTPGVASIALEVDGQRVDAHNGPERWLPLRWPGEGSVHGARLRVRGASIDETIAQEGEWGLFRLIESGAIEETPGARTFSVRFRLRTQHDVVIDVRPARIAQPWAGAGGRSLPLFRASDVEVPREILRGAKECR